MSSAPALSLLRPAQVEDGDEAPYRQVTQPIAIDAYTDHPEVALTPARALAIFRLAEDGFLRDQCNLFDGLLERNATARQLFDGRRAAVSGKEWAITPDGTDGDAELAASILDEAHRNLEYGELGDTFDHQLKHVSHGFAASEIDWGLRTIGGRTWVVPTGYVSAPHRRFRVVVKTDELRLLTEDSPIDGEALAPGKWWVTLAPGDRIARAGLMRPATQPIIWSSYAVRDWLVKSERFGLPLALASYDPQTDDGGKKTAMDVVRRIGSESGAAIPNNVKVDLKEVAPTGDGGIHGGLIAHANRELAKLVAGGTLSTDSSQSGQGSYAQAEVHAMGRHELVEGDASRLQRAWQRCVAIPFLRYNSLTCRPPQLKIQVARDQTPKALIDAADTLVNKLRIPVSQSQLRQISSLRAPRGEDDAVAPAPPPPAAAPPPAKGPATP